MAKVIEDTGDTHIIHEHGDAGDRGAGFLIGLVLVVVLVLLFIYYGVPALKGVTSSQINVPDKVDVNVNRQ